MAKLKKHSGLSKVLKVRSGGTVSFKQPGLNHKTGKMSGSMNRKKRKSKVLNSSDLAKLKRIITR